MGVGSYLPGMLGVVLEKRIPGGLDAWARQHDHGVMLIARYLNQPIREVLSWSVGEIEHWRKLCNDQIRRENGD